MAVDSTNPQDTDTATEQPPGPLLAALRRVLAARQHVHLHSCPDVIPGSTYCRACPYPMAVAAALDVLDVSPRDAAAARAALHSQYCDCSDDGDHARRTQTKRAAALRRFRVTETEVR